VLNGDPAPLSPTGQSTPPPIFGPYFLWPNGCMYQDVTWYGARPRPRRLCVRWGPSRPPQQGAEPNPQFLAHFHCGQTAGCIKMPLGMEVGLSREDFVLDGDQVLPPQKWGGAPQFLAHVYCGQRAGWIKMPLGKKVGLSPGDSVLDGDPAPFPNRRLPK